MTNLGDTSRVAADLPLPPGPDSAYLIKNMERVRRDWLGFLTWCAREYGDVASISIGTMRTYLLSHPEHIETVLIKHNRDFIKDLALRSSRHIFGNGLLTSEGSTWLSQRRLMQPWFHRERIATYGEIMVSAAEQMMRSWQPGTSRNIHEDMIRLTLEIVAKTLFGVERADEIDLERLDEFTYALIAQRRTTDPLPDDLLSMLLTAEDEHGQRLTDQQVRDEVVTLFLAGHETTASSLSWIWYLLAQHPEVEAELLAELDVVLGGRPPTIADLPRLRYTDMVVKEALRLYPSIWGFGREALCDTAIGGFFVPAGTTLMMSEWVVHRDPRFFAQPETFDPARWTEEFNKTLPKFAYFPFGGGPRLCIGNTFATTQAVMLLASIVPQFRFTCAPGYVVQPWPALTLLPKDGVHVLVERR